MTKRRAKFARNLKDRMFVRLCLRMSVFIMFSPHVVTDEGDIGQGEREDVENNEPGGVEEGAPGEDLSERPRRVNEGRILRAPLLCVLVGDDLVDDRVLVADDLMFEAALLADPGPGYLARSVEEARRRRDPVGGPRDA